MQDGIDLQGENFLEINKRTLILLKNLLNRIRLKGLEVSNYF